MVCRSIPCHRQSSCMPETPAYNRYPRIPTNKATRVNVQPYLRKPFVNFM
nr:MAG TPA: hypothetical protein [Caudoviricetes sp.]